MQDFFISIFVTILSDFTEYKIVLLDTCPCSSFLAFWISMSSCNCFSLINSASFFSSSARIFSVSSSTGGVFSFTCKTRQVRTRGSIPISTHRFTNEVGVDMDLGVGGAAVNRHRRTWRRFGVSYWPGWVDLLNLHVQLRNKAHTPRSEHWWLT